MGFEVFSQPHFIWIFVALALMVLEFLVPGLIIVFFSVGALIVAVLTLLFNIPLNVQLIVFILVSSTLLFALRRWLKGIFMGHTSSPGNNRSDHDEFLGEKAVVTKAIQENLPGKIELHGTNWKAEADEAISAGTVVEIVGRRNIAMQVKRID